MNVGDFQHPRIERLDLRIKSFHMKK
jgi:hypothetical protein